MLSRRSARRDQLGLSLVELMVGIAIGLFVVAAATLVIVTQLGNNRRLLLETQLQQDLRATMDIVTRELRRAGGSAAALPGVWFPGSPQVARNLLGAVPVKAGFDEVQFRYRRDGDEGPFGFKRDGGTIRSLLGGSWQELTDANVMKVTRFRITPTVSTETVECPRACSAVPNDTACWPTLEVRRYTVEIAAEAQHDAGVTRSLRSEVRLRNDLISFNDAAHPDRVCPE
jgi:type IV pilus assembly protein PilW